jgi:hypothetical protein
MSDRPFVPPRSDDRPAWRPPFRGPVPSPRPAPDHALPLTTFRLREGEREVEVSGAPGFVRQVLDDLPALLARLRGEPAPTPASIRMPAPSPQPVAESAPPPTQVHAVAPAPPLVEAAPPARPSAPQDATASTDDADGSVEERVLAALRGSSHPLPISAIRHRIGDEVTGQQVRRILERAGRQVVASGDRPMRYRLR